MSSEIAIKVENLSKCYQIYSQPHDRLKQSIYPRLQCLVGKQPAQYFREFWALKDISFEIKKGETVGIIGRNGSGKSTLLQMICGTLNPTSGSIQTHGRIAALLELGSGFNPEFTGRENVYMNAAVLGLSREETDARFADIAVFADIGDFIEQPAKTYSSGMMVRLAFAVIAHVDADILVVDEALAVGDAVFTQKCMRFLRRFMEQGTVLFVSHDIGSVTNLCQKAIWLDQSIMKKFDVVTEVTKDYAEHCAQEIYGDNVKVNLIQVEKRAIGRDANVVEQEKKISFYADIANSDGWATGKAEVLKVCVFNQTGEPVSKLAGGENVLLQISAVAHQDLLTPIIGFYLKDRLGQALFGENTFFDQKSPGAALSGDFLDANFSFCMPLLPNGEYSITIAVGEGDPSSHVAHHWLHDAAILSVQSSKLRYGLVGIEFESVTLIKRSGG